MEQNRPNESERARFRFSLGLMLRLVMFLPLSIGVIWVARRAAERVTSLNGPNWADRLADKISLLLGGLSAENRLFFVRASFDHLLVCFGVSAILLLLWRIRVRWLHELSFSLFLAIPLENLIIVWHPLLPLTSGVVVLLGKALLASALVASLPLLFFSVLLQRARSNQQNTYSAGRVVQTAIFAIYLGISIYGWLDIRRSEKETTEAFEAVPNHLRSQQNPIG